MARGSIKAYFKGLSSKEIHKHPRFHDVLFVAATIYTILVTAIWICLGLVIGWFSHSYSGVLAWCGVSIFALLPAGFVIYFVRGKYTFQLWFGALVVVCFTSIMVCGDLLGLGAIGYSEYAATAIANNLTLADTKLFSDSTVGGYYFTGKYTIVVQMSGTTSIKYDCGTKMGCDPYLHVAPLISGTDVDTFLQNRTTVKLWVAMTSSESDPLKVFPQNGTFNNGAISLSAKPEDATKAKTNACANITCGESVNAPVLLIGDVRQAISTSTSLMIAGYITTASLGVLIIVFVSFTCWVRYTNLDYNKVATSPDNVK